MAEITPYHRAHREAAALVSQTAEGLQGSVLRLVESDAPPTDGAPSVRDRPHEGQIGLLDGPVRIDVAYEPVGRVEDLPPVVPVLHVHRARVAPVVGDIVLKARSQAPLPRGSCLDLRDDVGGAPSSAVRPTGRAPPFGRGSS